MHYKTKDTRITTELIQAMAFAPNRKAKTKKPRCFSATGLFLCNFSAVDRASVISQVSCIRRLFLGGASRFQKTEFSTTFRGLKGDLDGTPQTKKATLRSLFTGLREQQKFS
jgi:hypothetical protein